MKGKSRRKSHHRGTKENEERQEREGMEKKSQKQMTMDKWEGKEGLKG